MTKSTTNSNISLSDTSEFYEYASSEIRYNMTNDYMFRAVLQQSEFALRGLICSLLHLDFDEIKDLIIVNPNILGDSVEYKENRLDVFVLLNNNTVIDLEMQFYKMQHWNERAMLYLCRSYDQLMRGEDYGSAKRVIHIAFLEDGIDGALPEFYAEYSLANAKNHKIFSDKITMRVVNLNQTELVTDEDRAFALDAWAKFFTAKTWEVVKMLAKDNEYIESAANAMYILSADFAVRKRCLEREEYLATAEGDKRRYAQMRAERDEALTATAKEHAKRTEAEAIAAKAIAERDEALSATAKERAKRAEADAKTQEIYEWAVAHGFNGERP